MKDIYEKLMNGYNYFKGDCMCKNHFKEKFLESGSYVCAGNYLTRMRDESNTMFKIKKV